MADIFLSYAHADEARAHRIAQALEAEGWSVWSDRKLRAGNIYPREIQEALKAARCVVVLWSAVSVESQWVYAEAEAGRKRRILIPIQIEHGVELPLPFTLSQTVSLIGWSGAPTEVSFQQLVRDISAIIGNQPRMDEQRPAPAPPSRAPIEAVRNLGPVWKIDSDRERLEVGAISETGYAREENQDRMSGALVPLGNLYIVADGRHTGGALAAQMAVEVLQRHISHAAPGERVHAVIAAAFKAANDAVCMRAHSGNPAAERMGTTVVLLLISGRTATVAHVGDSRAYLYRNNRLSRLTTDHTWAQRVQLMVEAGKLKPEEAAKLLKPESNVLERAIGSAPTIDVDLRDHQLQEGDAVLLCSDGLSGCVADAQIEAALRAERSVQEMTADLVRLALETGGRDNITVQLIRYGARNSRRP